MRRLVCFTMVAISLAVPAAGLALNGGDDDGTLSVKAGVGRVNLNFNGSAVGRLQRGSIQVTDPVVADGLGFDFWGCEKTEKPKGDTTSTVCRGTNLRFRAIGGRYQIQIRGSGIYLSAVGHGSANIDGSGENPNVDSDGTYSLNDNAYKSLPDFGASLQLAAPAGG